MEGVDPTLTFEIARDLAKKDPIESRGYCLFCWNLIPDWPPNIQQHDSTCLWRRSRELFPNEGCRYEG